MGVPIRSTRLDSLLHRFAALAVVLVIVPLFTVPVVSPNPARADEGMWLLHALDKAPFEVWQKNGLKLGKAEIYSPRGADISDAVVQVGGGTGSFVSSEGLIVTNHHVAFGALQRSSSVKGRGPRPSLSWRVGPSTYSMAMKAFPSTSPVS